MSETMPIVHVVDDDASFLVALARLLKAAGYAVQTYASAADFLAKLGEGAGCVVTDLRMPGMDGLDLQQALMRAANVLPVVFLTGEGDIPTTVRGDAPGGRGLPHQARAEGGLLAAVDRAIARDARQRAETAHGHALRARFDPSRVASWWYCGTSSPARLNKQIAADLGINERTVKLHRTAITTKLEVHSVAELTRLAQAAGLFDGTPANLP
jgi:two-component system response regulator FixJ